LKVEKALRRMRAQGFDPVVHEAWRSPERAARLAEEGTGIPRSTHTYGGAVDIISESEWWNISRDFKLALRDAAEAEGLYWGGHFGDWPHVQAIPTGRPQQEFIAATLAERSDMVTA